MCAHKNKMNFDYDVDHDVLYVSFGRPMPSYCADDIGGVLLLKSYKSHKLSGFTVMDFSKKKIRQIEKAIPVEINLDDIRSIRQPLS